MLVQTRQVNLAMIAIVTCFLTGCGTVMESAHFDRSGIVETDPSDQRLLYQTNGDSNALRWLLRHELRQGMTLADVNQTLGEDGTREYDAGWIKNNGSFRIDDEVYKWGPDTEGNSVYLVFRNGNLTNYDPSDFE